MRALSAQQGQDAPLGDVGEAMAQTAQTVTETVDKVLPVWAVNLLIIGLMLTVTVVLARMVNHFFHKAIARMHATGNDAVTLLAFCRYLGLAAVYFVGAIAVTSRIPGLQNITQTVLAGSGVVALVISFASQEAVGNLAAGVMILLFKPFVLGDVIRYVDSNITGTVEEITLRHTTIRTPENKRVIVPNGIINKSVVENANYGESKVCVLLEIGISYESDIQLAMDIMTREMIAHPDYYDNRTEQEIDEGAPPVTVRVVELADSAVILRAWLWAKDNATAFVMKCDLLQSIKLAFDRDGVDIAYPHVTVVQK